MASTKDYYILSKEVCNNQSVWRIEQFSKKLKGNFSSEKYGSNGVQWEWTLVEDKSTDIELHMNITFEKESIFLLNIKCVINSQEKAIGKMEKSFSLEKFPNSSASKFKLGELTKKKELKANYLDDDTLEIHFEIIIRVLDVTKTITTETVTSPSQIFSKQIGNLLNNSRLADVIICVEGKEISAHKDILSARSSVFAAKFEDQSCCKLDVEEDLKGMKHSVMEEFLRFIYTGKLNNLEFAGCGLLQAADKYAIEDLREICEIHLMSKVSINNALMMLILADQTNGFKLKGKAIDFINKNRIHLRKTSEWKELQTNYAKLIVDLYNVV